MSTHQKNSSQKTGLRPICVNTGCDQPVTYSHTARSGVRRWRPVCSRCQRASYGNGDHAPGVVPIKKAHCENQDGRLGYQCTAHIAYPGVLELDHRDGDRCNNDPDNIQTLCKVCHSYKGHISNDFRRRRLTHSQEPVIIATQTQEQQ